LVKVKEMLENPARMLHSGNDPAIDLLGLRWFLTENLSFFTIK
jgi:hypothetical protein